MGYDKEKVLKKRSAEAKALQRKQFRQQIVKDKKKDAKRLEDIYGIRTDEDISERDGSEYDGLGLDGPGSGDGGDGGPGGKGTAKERTPRPRQV